MRSLTKSAARTHATEEDPRLRGRTYSIPFEDVWQSALRIIGGEFRRAHVVSVDDVTGDISVEVGVIIPRATLDVAIRITLDDDAQTRVDMRVIARDRRFDLGASRRLILRFFALLDKALSELDPARDSLPLAS